MGFKFSSPLKYGTKKKEQSAMKRIMSGKKALSKQDSKKRINKAHTDTLQIIKPKNQVSPTARLNNTFGSRKVIK